MENKLIINHEENNFLQSANDFLPKDGGNMSSLRVFISLTNQILINNQRNSYYVDEFEIKSEELNKEFPPMTPWCAL